MSTSSFLSRRPARLRLALIYSGLFLLAGAVLLAITYGLAANSLPTSASQVRGNPAGSTGLQACEASAVSAGQIAQCKKEAAQVAQGIADATVQDERAQTLSHLLFYSLGGLALMAVISAALGWLMAGRVLRPVHAITAAARRASQANLSERIGLTGPEDELKELADTFDAMLARLESAFASQRRFVANASHELRTPLTVMRTAIDVTLAKPQRTPDQLEAMAVDVRHAVEQAETLIEALLTLARSDRGLGPRGTFDMAVLAEDALDVAMPAAEARGLDVRSELQPGSAVGDNVLAERLVTNLIGNAVRHNVPDGWIRVATGCGDGVAFISVANSGPVVPESAVSSLFEPFYRLAQGSGTGESEGAGLGLSIAQSVVAAHGGHVSARPVPGGGLAVMAVLPRLGLDVLRDGVEQARDLPGFLRVRVLAAPVGVRDPVEQLHKVFDDRDHLVRLLACVLRGCRRDVGWRLKEPHLQCLGPLASLHDAEFDPLSLGQGGRPGRQRGRMHENLAPVIAGEEAEPLFGVIPLDLAGRHEQDLTSVETWHPAGRDRRQDVMGAF
jgi:signal transduction histidine kinase